MTDNIVNSIVESLFYLLELNTVYLNKHYPINIIHDFKKSNTIESIFPTEYSINNYVSNRVIKYQDYLPLTTDFLRYVQKLSYDLSNIIPKNNNKHKLEDYFDLLSNDISKKIDKLNNLCLKKDFNTLHKILVYPVTLSESEKLNKINLIYDFKEVAQDNLTKYFLKYNTFTQHLT